MKSKGYDISLIRKYLNGELDAAAMYRLEREAQDDPMLMDLIAGMESGDEKEHGQAIRELEGLIMQRTGGRRRRVVPLVRWTVAASVLILCGLTWFALRKELPAVKTAARTENRKPGEIVEKPVAVQPDTIIPAMPMDQPLKVAELRRKQRLKTRIAGERIPEVGAGEQDIVMLDKQGRNDSAKLNEVVVVGYGSQNKASLTGAVSSVAAPDTSIVQALSGRLAGISVSNARVRVVSPIMLVSGVVKDKEVHSVLPGVTVKVAGSSTSTVTDHEGRFTLPVPESGAKLELKYIGYGNTFVNVKNSDSLMIAMQPSNHELNEVAVMGYSRKHKMNEARAEEVADTVRPSAGWKDFYTYLKEKAVTKKGKKGTVMVSFKVSTSGQLSDFKIIKSDNPALNETAIRLIKEGPEWTGPKDGSEEIRLMVKFMERKDIHN